MGTQTYTCQERDRPSLVPGPVWPTGVNWEIRGRSGTTEEKLTKTQNITSSKEEGVHFSIDCRNLNWFCPITKRKDHAHISLLHTSKGNWGTRFLKGKKREGQIPLCFVETLSSYFTRHNKRGLDWPKEITRGEIFFIQRQKSRKESDPQLII